MDLQQVARGLWRWTEPHPEWEAPEEEDSPADWPRDVGCVASATNDSLELLDLPVESVLVSHGEPVLRDGRRELERALG